MVYIDDSCIVKTEEERQRIMDQIRAIAISMIEERKRQQEPKM